MSKPLGTNYWKLWSASVVSNLGDGISMIAYPWLASALTRNPIHIAAVAVVTRPFRFEGRHRAAHADA